MERLAILAIGFAAGWFAHLLRERREKPRKRTRAIPSGTEATKRPGRPRKAPKTPQEPPQEPPALDMSHD